MRDLSAAFITAVLIASGAAAQGNWWLPVAAHNPGVDGSLWRTDMTVLNHCDRDATVELVLHTPTGRVAATYVVPAGAQQVFPDVVGALGAGDATAALEISSDQGITVTSRTYNLTAAGTFGQSIGAVDVSDGLAAGQEGTLQQLREDGEFRTNLGVLNMGAGTAVVEVTLYDTLGTALGSYELEVPSERSLQDHRPYAQRLGRTDIAAGFARLTVVTGDGVWAWASVVDNTTADPLTVPLLAPPDCPVDIADRLATIPGMTVLEGTSGNAGYRRFQLRYHQPVDHSHPDAGEFVQFVTLLHRSDDAPVVLETLGYTDTWGERRAELTQMLDANQLVVEHRFFGRSVPENVDWQLLTIAQAAADHHRLVEALRPIYPGAWISTGHSKGGMTAVYHRRFYPEDVDATVPYVAPISYGVPDETYVPFFASVGEAACRQQLAAIQVAALGRRAELLELMATVGTVARLSFDLVGGREAALESVVLEVPFTFWQYAGASYCSQVPDTSADDLSIFTFLDRFVGFAYASDATFDYYGPYFYQAHAELGYPALPEEHLEGLILTDPPTIEEGVLPAGATATFDQEVMPDIAAWLAAHGERFLFIYGENDPWTAGAFELGDASDSWRFIVPEGNHGAAISLLETDDQATVREILERWTGVAPSVPKAMPYDELHPPWRREVPPLDRR